VLGLESKDTSKRELGSGYVRVRIRNGSHTGHTAGICQGYVQANLVVLPQRYAQSFREFCNANPQACPLLGECLPGDPSCPFLAHNLDLRMDVPRYRVYRHGELDCEVADIEALWQNDFVAFLLGCSFSFERALIEAGVRLPYVERGGNVAMFRTTIPTIPVGPFKGPLVVSMRALAPSDVPRAVQVTARFPLAHGAPVHVGSPDSLGISNLECPDFGDPPHIDLIDQVPVFWACGVTSQMAVIGAKLPLVITHAPGHMVITDILNRELEHPADPASCEGNSVRPVAFKKGFSPAVKPTQRAIEEVALDGDSRGMKQLALHLPRNFVMGAAQHLLGRVEPYSGKRVLVVTGFYVMQSQACETDGPPGAAAIAHALEGLGCAVTILTDHWSETVVKAAATEVGVEVAVYPHVPIHEANQVARAFLQEFRPDAIISIERAGLMSDGTYRNFRNVDMSAYNAPMDALFHVHTQIDGEFNGTSICTIGIGDGGNEIGMGHFSRDLASIFSIRLSVTRCDRVIVASTSNLGAYAMVAALSILTKRNLLISPSLGRVLVERCVGAGAVDGISGRQELSVDGVPLDSRSGDVAQLQRLHDLLLQGGL